MVASSNKPVQVFRLRGVTASVFANSAKHEGRDIVFHKVSLQRTYREGDEFKTTASLNRDDIPVAQLLMQRAWEYILQAEANRGKAEESEIEG